VSAVSEASARKRRRDMSVGGEGIRVLPEGSAKVSRRP
jgi:hypothetical protein